MKILTTNVNICQNTYNCKYLYINNTCIILLYVFIYTVYIIIYILYTVYQAYKL